MYGHLYSDYSPSSYPAFTRANQGTSLAQLDPDGICIRKHATPTPLAGGFETLGHQSSRPPSLKAGSVSSDTSHQAPPRTSWSDNLFDDLRDGLHDDLHDDMRDEIRTAAEKGWTVCLQARVAHDKRMIDDWKEELNSILVFVRPSRVCSHRLKLTHIRRSPGWSFLRSCHRLLCGDIWNANGGSARPLG